MLPKRSRFLAWKHTGFILLKRKEKTLIRRKEGRDYEDVERQDEEKEAAVNANKLKGGTKNEKLKDTLDDKVE